MLRAMESLQILRAARTMDASQDNGKRHALKYHWCFFLCGGLRRGWPPASRLRRWAGEDDFSEYMDPPPCRNNPLAMPRKAVWPCGGKYTRAQNASSTWSPPRVAHSRACGFRQPLGSRGRCEQLAQKGCRSRCFLNAPRKTHPTYYPLTPPSTTAYDTVAHAMAVHLRSGRLGLCT